MTSKCSDIAIKPDNPDNKPPAKNGDEKMNFSFLIIIAIVIGSIGLFSLIAGLLWVAKDRVSKDISTASGLTSSFPGTFGGI